YYLTFYSLFFIIPSTLPSLLIPLLHKSVSSLMMKVFWCGNTKFWPQFEGCISPDFLMVLLRHHIFSRKKLNHKIKLTLLTSIINNKTIFLLLGYYLQSQLHYFDKDGWPKHFMCYMAEAFQPCKEVKITTQEPQER
ncbi:hypothetical protein VIGAN_01179500, partial [Vigna angularis var. angularis]